VSIYVQTCPGRSGWQWLQKGITHVRQRPGELFLLGNSYLFIMLVLGAFIPVLGPLLLIALGPVLNFGTMHIGQCLQQGHKVGPGHLFAALRVEHRQHLRPLLMLSLMYTVLFEAAKLLCDTWVGQAPKLEGIGNPSQVDPAQLQALTEYAVRYTIATALTTLPIIVLFWYAPALLIWQGMKPMQALFSSMVAAWRNKTAFLVYGLAWLAMGAVVMAMPVGILRVLGVPTMVVGAIQMIALAIVLAVSIASFYTSYTSVFVPAPERKDPMD
jgi:hypothetical protein